MASDVEFSFLSDDDGDSISDEESCDSSDEDAESGDDDDEEMKNESNSNVECKLQSSDDDHERECCPVCLNKFIGQDLGTPESCEHTFCFECIKEWSKNINTCPIDRTEFNFINLRAIPGGNILRKVKVKVCPKEVEEALQDSVTLCEVCHNGDREDRLLLCDGCDLAYHCDCLDPPLFYVPIEEWFCPPCSGVLQNGAVAGPSSSRRRVIPRTRASEAVRSRVQNLRSGGSTAPRATSKPRNSNNTNKPRKRKRRSYRRTYKKVVQLARTKKDMTDGGKSKVGARGSTVIVTYRRKRRRRRTAKRKFSRRSLASTRAIPMPSSKQRIAKRLGISKPLQGSSLPQVKQPARSRSTSRVSKMPSHSLFGNRNQLMDFNENFNEITNIPSTSSADSPRRRPSSDSFSSSIPGLSILDSIMADQKLLHSKSENIVIKNDGSLILKEMSSDSKKVNKTRKIESDPPVRPPMSVALVKTGVKNLVSVSGKQHVSGLQKNTDTSKEKNVIHNKSSKSSNEKVRISNSSNNRWTSKSNCSNSKSHTESRSSVKRFSDKESYRKSSVTTMNISKKRQEISSRSSVCEEDRDGLMDGFECDISSDGESEISNEAQSLILNKSAKERMNSYLESSSSSNSTFTSFQRNKHMHDQCSDRTAKAIAQISKPYIKEEVLSDDETDTGAISGMEQAINIKKEILSDDETNVDTWVENGENRGQEVDNRMISRIKAEPVDSDPELVMINKSERSCTYENEVCDFETSQSIIDTVPNNISHLSLDANLDSKLHVQKKIKEEVPSDTEDYSQSLVSTANTNFVSQSVSSYFSHPTKMSSSYNKKNKRFSESTRTVSHNFESVSNSKNSEVSAKGCRNSYAGDKQNKGADRKNTVAIVPSEFLSVDMLPPTQILTHSAGTNSLSEDENMPCTQVDVPAVTDSSSEDEDMPCTQIVSSPAVIDSSSEDEDMPCTQVAPTAAVDSSSEGDDLPCTQAVPLSVARNNLSDDDYLPCTQAVSLSVARYNLSDEDDLPCTQAVSLSVARHNLSDEDDLPCTQAVSLSVARHNLSDEDDLPCTQAVSFSVARHNLFEDQDLPCTQAVSFPVINNKNAPDCTSSSDVSDHNNSFIDISDTEIPPTQLVIPKSDKNFNIHKHPSAQGNQFSRTKSKVLFNISNDQFSDNELPPTQMNSEFLKPAAVSNKGILCSQNGVKKYKNFPTATSEVNLTTKGELPSTLCLETHTTLNSNPNTVLDNLKNAPSIQDDLPATQLFTACPDKVVLPETQSVVATSESLATQISNIPSNKVNVPNATATNHLSTLSELKNFIDTSKVLDLHNTQVANETFSLSATKLLCASSKENNLLEPLETESADEPFSLPATQILNSPPKREKFFNPQSGTIHDESFSLPATQVSSALKEYHVPDAQIDSESLSLPATQINHALNKPIKASDVSQTRNLRNESSAVPATQRFNPLEKTVNVSDTLTISEDCELFTLPATQISNISANVKEASSGYSKVKTGSHNSKLIHNKTMCLDDESEKQETSNMNDIISNIKHIVNSLSVKDPENPILLDPEKDANDKKLPCNDDHNVSDESSHTQFCDDSSLPATQISNASKEIHLPDTEINVSNKNIEFDIPVESVGTDDTSDAMSICNNSEGKDQENLQPSDLGKNEELCHEKLKEIASKSSNLSPNKNVGIHKHLPQVIAKVPAKEHIKLKPCNRKTFSFEEVAKLEPEKTPNNLLTNSKQKVSEHEIHESISSDNNMDDELPPTQKVDFETVKNKSIKTKKFHNESHLNSVKCLGINNSKVVTSLNDKFAHNSSSARIEENEDFPATQLAQSKDCNLSKTHISVNTSKINRSTVVEKTQPCTSSNKNESKSVESCSSFVENINNESVLFDSDESVLPAAQTQRFNSENFSDRPMKINKHLSGGEKNDLAGNKNKTIKNKNSINIISIKNRETLKHGTNNRAKKFSEFVDLNDLPSTQAFNNFSEENSLNIPDKRVKNRHHRSNSSEINSVDVISKKNSVTTSSGNKLKHSTQGKAKEPSLEIEFDDLPATQVCDNDPKKASSKHVENSTGTKTTTNYQNNAVASFTATNNPSELRKSSEASDTSNPTSCKRKSSFNDDMHKQKKGCDSISQTNGSLDVRMKEGEDRNTGLKRSHEYKKSGEELGRIFEGERSSKRLKKVSDKEQKLVQSDKKYNPKKDKLNLSSDHRKELPSRKVNSVKDNTVHELTDKGQDLTCHTNNCGVITVKQEKIDPDFKMPLIETQLSNLKDSSHRLNVSGVRIKSENTSDSLPANQVASFNLTNGASNGTIINNIILSSSLIKKEVCSDDDEISIIELNMNHKTKIKEIIIDDDDDDDIENTISHVRETDQSNCFVKCEKEVPVQTKINISSIKKENCCETNKEVSSKSKIKSSKISTKQSETKDARKSSSKEKEKCDKSSIASKHAEKNHKTMDKSKSSKDSQISKEEKQKKDKTHVLKSKPESTSRKHDMKSIEKSKNLGDSPKEKKLDSNSLKSKTSNSDMKNSSKLSSMQLAHPTQNQQEKSKVSSDKQKVKSSEKENNSSSVKSNCLKNDIIITLKPSKKRTHESSESKGDQKRKRYDSLDSESCSSEDTSSDRMKNGSLKSTNSNVNLKTKCDLINDRISISTPRSDVSIESVNVAKDSSKTSLTGDVKKILSKQDLKEEIANEVKLVLKPFFSTGLISKEDYKDIMRRAVPKIFMNCHNCINPEKIRKLVLSYVTLLSKS